MAKFQVSRSPRVTIPLGNSKCVGGTWYSAGDVGIDEENLARDYPFLVWDSKPKTFVKETSKVSTIKPKSKLSEDEFYELTRSKQEVELDKLNIKHTKKDKESDLWNKYKSV